MPVRGRATIFRSPSPRVRGAPRLARPEVVLAREEDPPEAGPVERVLRREVGSSVEDLAVRGEEGGEGPAPLARQGAHGLLGPRVDVGALVPVDLQGDGVLVDDRRNLGILVRLPVDYVAPVAPRRPDVEEDGR